MNVDDLSPISRDFYELSRFKTTASLVAGGASMMLLGFSSSSGGLAASAAADLRNYETQGFGGATDKFTAKATLQSQGFACCNMLLGSFLLLFFAIYISPLCCGTANEKRILNVPQEIDANTTASYGEGSRDAGNQKWNQYGNNRGGSSSEDTYAYGDSNPKTVEGYNPSPNARSLNSREKRSSQGSSARSSDPQSNSFADWPEADETGDRGNNRNRINVAIDK